MLVVVGTLLVAAVANWTIASAWMGGSIGLDLWDATMRMGPHLAWTLVTLANGAVEWLWLAVAVAVGAWLAR